MPSAHIHHALDESAIVVVTDADGKIIYTNEMFCRISGYSHEELMGKTHRLINSGYHSKTFFAEMWKTIKQGLIWRGNIRNQRKDGSYYWVSTTIVPLVNHKGIPIQYTAIRFDITEQKRVEDEIKQLYNQLEERVKERTQQLSDTVNQLKATEAQRERFVAALTHDLRTPLIGQQRGLDILKNNCSHFSETVQPILARMSDSNASLLGMVNRLLEYAHLESGETPLQLSTHALDSLIQCAVKNINSIISEKKIDFSFDIPPNLKMVVVDAHLFERMLTNLLANSASILDADGSGKIHCSAKKLASNDWELCVSDNGPGIPTKMTPYLFEPYRIDLNRKIGSGLGLSICKMIAERHGGTIELEKDNPNGAMFRIRLPIISSY